MNPIDRYLDILGVKRGASRDDLRAAYRALIQISHPDRFHDNESLRKTAETQTKLLNEAYKYLAENWDRVSAPSPSPTRPRIAPETIPTGAKARDAEQRRRQDAEYQRRKAQREAREALQYRRRRDQGKQDRITIILGVVFVVLLILYGAYARHQRLARLRAHIPVEARDFETE